MRVRLPARFLPRLVAVVLAVALLAALLPALGVTARPHQAAAAPAAQAAGCSVNGTNLVVNGSFELPGIPSGSVFGYTPDGWTGSVSAVRSVPGDFIDQNVYIDFLLGGLTQTLDTTGLGGAQLTVAYNTKSVYGADELPLIQIGDQELSFTTGGFRLSQTVTLPENIGPSTTLILGGVNYGGPGNKAIDAVSVVVSACPAPPLARVTLDLDYCSAFGASAALFSTLDPYSCNYDLDEKAFRGGEVTLSAGQFYAADGTPRGATVSYDGTADTLDLYVPAAAATLTVTAIENGRYPASVALVPVAGATIPLTFTFVSVERNDDAPVFSGLADTVTTDDVTGVSSDFSVTDPDGTGDVTVTTQPAAGTVAVTSTGVSGWRYTYTPTPGSIGAFTFDLSVSDDIPAPYTQTTTETVTVTVTRSNRTPVASNDTYTVPEDTTLSVTTRATGVLGNDTDADPGQAATLTAAVVGNPSHGTLTLNSDGTFTYIPSPNYNGTDTFTYTASDGTATSNVATVTLTVQPINDAPVIAPGSVPAPITAPQTTPAGAVVTYPTPTATDIDGEPVTVTCAPASGSTFARGTTTVTCTARDGNGGEDVETFTVTVTDQGAPVFTGLPNVTVGATSNYGAVVTYAPPTATDNVSVPTVSCLPAPGSQFPIGTTTVTCTASDGVNSTVGSFTVTVTNNGFRDPRDPRPGASPITQPPPTPTPRPARPPRG